MADFGTATTLEVITATGDYHKFETQKLGKIEIEEAGEMTLTIRPDLEAWKPVNLKKVILRPAK